MTDQQAFKVNETPERESSERVSGAIVRRPTLGGSTTNPARKPGRRLRALAVMTFGVLAVPFFHVTAAEAAGQGSAQSCGPSRTAVPVNSPGVLSSVALAPGQSLTFTGGGIVSPSWFVGAPNGPEGRAPMGDSSYPLPGAPTDSLLAKVNADWMLVGAGGVVVNTGTTIERVQFRINHSRNLPALVSGYLTATTTLCGYVDWPSPYHLYTIRARHSAMCLDVAYASTEHAASVVQGTCWYGTNQQWGLVSAGNGFFQIVARHSGKCLDVAHASEEHGANVVQATCSGGANQQWGLAPTSNDFYFQVVARHTGMCLDVAHASMEHAAGVVQGTCGDGANQQWKFGGTSALQ